MENAADALKIAFAVIVFSIALALTFSFISQAKSTSDHVLYYTDETSFYDYAESGTENRTVTSSEVIAMLHKYYIESIAVIVKIEGNEYIFDSGNETIVKENGDIDRNSTAKLNTSKEKEENLARFISKKITSGMVFTEEFVEAPISGIYKSDDNNSSEIVITPGGSKVYVTYTLKQIIWE